MEREVLAWLEDIIQSIDEIEMFLPENRNFYEFQNDLKTRKAIERNIEIIGEAVSRVLRVHPEVKITNARKIVDTRNRIIHGYDSVSEEIIWAIATKDLLKLREEVADLLNG